MELRIAGVQWVSCIDFPGELSTVLFTAGCNLSCEYCYNLASVQTKGECIGIDALVNKLLSRKGLIDAVVISGGEPTLQTCLPDLIVALATVGFKVKLDTNGMRPVELTRCLETGCLAYIAMDLKAPPSLYSEVAGRAVHWENFLKSIDLLRAWSGRYEFRTTVLPGFIVEDLVGLARLIKGAPRLVVQPFKSTKTSYVSRLLHQDSSLSDFSSKVRQLKILVSDWFGELIVRN